MGLVLLHRSHQTRTEPQRLLKQEQGLSRVGPTNSRLLLEKGGPASAPQPTGPSVCRHLLGPKAMGPWGSCSGMWRVQPL